MSTWGPASLDRMWDNPRGAKEVSRKGRQLYHLPSPTAAHFSCSSHHDPTLMSASDTARVYGPLTADLFPSRQPSTSLSVFQFAAVFKVTDGECVVSPGMADLVTNSEILVTQK